MYLPTQRQQMRFNIHPTERNDKNRNKKKVKRNVERQYKLCEF